MSAVRPTLRLLEPEDVERIVSEACQALEATGVLVENEEARGLLETAGQIRSCGRGER